MNAATVLPPTIDSLFEQYKFYRISFVYLCNISDSQKDEALALCKQVAKIIKSRIPPDWWVMAYGPLVNGRGVDVVVVSRLNMLSPHLIYTVVLNPGGWKEKQ